VHPLQVAAMPRQAGPAGRRQWGPLNSVLLVMMAALAWSPRLVSAQLSSIAHDSNMEGEDNKFLQRSATLDQDHKVA